MWALADGREVHVLGRPVLPPQVQAGSPDSVHFVFWQRAAAVRALTVLPCVPPTPTPEGYIRNTEKLKYGKEHQYKLTVTAYDCGKKRAAEDVLVKISVQPTCTPGWQGELRPHLCARPCPPSPRGRAT